MARQNGKLAKYIGEGKLVCYPLTHEIKTLFSRLLSFFHSLYFAHESITFFSPFFEITVAMDLVLRKCYFFALKAQFRVDLT